MAERQAAARSIDDLLLYWGESIKAGGATAKHIEHATARAGTLFRACGFRSWSDIRPEPVERHLRALRERDVTAIRRPMEAMVEVPPNIRAYWFTEATAGPRSVIKAGLSPKSSNHYLQAARGFCPWMVARGFAVADPLRVLEPLNARVDRRVRRRALTEDGLRLLMTTAQAGPTRGLFPGPVRALAYALRAEAGFRVRELVALRVSSFIDLDGPVPSVTLPAHAAKNRRETTLPQRCTTARALSRLVAGRGALEPALGLPAAWRPPRAPRRDLERAGLLFEDESGRRFDAHALRGMLATRLFTSGASVPATQSLMRHSSADLTVSVYSRVRGGREERDALERMPDLLPPEIETARATGTTGTPDRGASAGSGEGRPVPAGSPGAPAAWIGTPVEAPRGPFRAL